MTTLTRVTGKVFGGNAPLEECGVFGSAKAGSPDTSTDIATIQSLPAYLLGWGSGVVSSNNFPPMEEVTGVLKTISYQACYSLQAGVPVYDIATDYGVGDIVKVVSGSNDTLTFYISQTTPNIGQSLSDTTYWKPATFLGSGAVGAPQFTMNPNAVLPNNCIWLEGQYLVREDYPRLAFIYDTTYNLSSDTDNTKFRLPDFRNRYIYGVNVDDSAFGYVPAGLPNLGLATTSNGAHKHDKGNMEIEGGFNGSQLIDRAEGVSAPVVSGAFTYGGMASRLTVGVGGDSSQTGFKFKASRSWTGYTSENGAHTHTVTSSNPIVGSTNTVKTDGIKVRVYTRYE